MNDVQDAIDPEADIALFSTWLNVDVAGTLIKRVLQQPVDQVNHVLVVCIEVTNCPQLG